MAQVESISTATTAIGWPRRLWPQLLLNARKIAVEIDIQPAEGQSGDRIIIEGHASLYEYQAPPANPFWPRTPPTHTPLTCGLPHRAPWPGKRVLACVRKTPRLRIPKS